MGFHSYAQAIPAMEDNRFQYHRYHWRTLPTPAFHIYYPEGYDSLASFASVQLPDIIEEAYRVTGVRLQAIPNLVIYPSIDQLYESNIGLREHQMQTFPTIVLKGMRVLLAFNGSYEQFRLQLKEAWLRLCWEEQFRNEALEQLNNTKALFPSWFKEGSIRYFSQRWSLDKEAQLQQLFQDRQISSWADMLAADSLLSGQAFCYYISTRYRQDALKQVLFQLRGGKSLSRALRLVLKRPLDTLSSQCFLFYSERFETLTPLPSSSDTPAVLPRGERLLQRLAGPDGQSELYITKKDKLRKVYWVNRADASKEKTLSRPLATYRIPSRFRNNPKDPHPLVQWSANGTSAYVLQPRKGRLVVRQYDRQGRQMLSRTLYGVEGVVDMEQAVNRKWPLAAFRRGKSDIVLYDPQRLRYEALTDDQADNLELDVLEDGAGLKLTYRSGYPADSLYHKDTLAKPYGIYKKHLQDERKAGAGEELLIKDSAYLSWHQPRMTGQGTLLLNHHAGPQAFPDTLSLSDKNLLSVMPDYSPWLEDYLQFQRTEDSIRTLLKQAATSPSFLSKVLVPEDAARQSAQRKDSIRQALAYTKTKNKPYVLQLYSAYFSAQVNNDYYINRYQPFQSYLGSFKFPEVGAMLQGGFSDLFDNHHITMAYRMPAGTDGSDFFARYENTKKLLDWHVLYFRKVESLQPDPLRDWTDKAGNPYPPLAKVKTHYYELGFHYPLQEDWSLELNLTARNDRTIFQAVDKYSLQYPDLQQWWSMNNGTLRVNKLQAVGNFLFRGWSSKLLLDGMISTGANSTLLYGLQWSGTYHQPLFKGINLVLGLQAGHSGGRSRILYNFGGMDNNIVPRLDTSVRFPQEAPYAFQTLVTPFRGYAQNSLYGSSYGLANADLYFPLFNGLIPGQTPASALNHLQLGLFADMAMVRADAALPAVTTPLYAYGISARTLLAGYPLRFDLAWPGNFGQQPVWYLSLTIR